MKKIYVFLIVLVLGFGVVMFLLYGVDSIKREKYETALVVGDNTTWIYQKNKWMRVEDNEKYAELNWQKYHIFELLLNVF